MRRFRLPASVVAAVAWIGLALMTASFIELLRVSTASLPESSRGSKVDPFAVVVIDPGHGGQDSGAMAGNISEKDLTLDVAQRVDRLLGAQGVPTLLTRNNDAYISLADRSAVANRTRNAIFVSIHFNDGDRPLASGVETYFAAHRLGMGAKLAAWLPFLRKISNEEPDVESQGLAGFIQQEVVTRTQATDRGTKAEQFYVLANVRHPAALFEGGFLTNKDDVTKLADANYREQLANAISRGILNYRNTLRQRMPAAGDGGAEQANGSSVGDF